MSIDDKIKEKLDKPRPCIICNKITRDSGVFVPDDLPERPVIVYGFCIEHTGLPVEQIDACLTRLLSRHGQEHLFLGRIQ